MDILTTESFLSYYDRIHSRTRRVVLSIPPDDLEWTYADGKFTFGDLVRHIAATKRYMFAENAAGRQCSYPGHGRELADGIDNVIEFFDRMHSESLEIFNAITNETLNQKCSTPTGTKLLLWKWLRAMIEHEVHHRGQIYVYLQMRNHPAPKLFGLTEKELRALSHCDLSPKT